MGGGGTGRILAAWLVPWVVARGERRASSVSGYRFFILEIMLD